MPAPRPTGKIQELVYEMKVEAVMKRKLITLAPDTPMSSLRAILRENRISGVPVVEGESLVGVISVEDFINWLAQGAPDCPVGQRMSRHVKTLSTDEPLVHAISKLEHFGYGRLPVVDGSTGRLVGLVTKGDIIEGLLQELQVDSREEEEGLHRYRASHFFEDMIADKLTVSQIVMLLAERPLSTGEISERLGLTPSHVSRYMQSSSREGLVRYDLASKCYTLT